MCLSQLRLTNSSLPGLQVVVFIVCPLLVGRELCTLALIGHQSYPGAPPSWLYLNLITSQRPRLLILIHWGLTFQWINFEGQEHSVHNILLTTSFWFPGFQYGRGARKADEHKFFTPCLSDREWALRVSKGKSSRRWDQRGNNDRMMWNNQGKEGYNSGDGCCISWSWARNCSWERDCGFDHTDLKTLIFCLQF